MKYIVGDEYRKFEKERETFTKVCKKAGVSAETIEEMNKFDKHQMNRDIAYKRKKIAYIDSSGVHSENIVDAAEEQIMVEDILEKNEYFSRYWWVETIENRRMYVYIKNLTKLELEVVTSYIIDDMTSDEISEKMDIPAEKIRWIIRKMRNFGKWVYK